ncbi:MAG: hypothetical protein A3F42_00700 [Gammaproteobacteria bacterium RIFCSPHIGHO2_12_FULL_37_34]|nr:MAG: hypothetical protein A3F42_00700 [Gammaproteobacteria bacterium RIFCSPHIGHO2_12_FULL_37_34]
MKNIFTLHPDSLGETYFQHFKFAFKFGVYMLIGGLACIVHAIFPFVFEKAASNFLLTMTIDFIRRQPKLDKRSKELLQVLQKKA